MYVYSLNNHDNQMTLAISFNKNAIITQSVTWSMMQTLNEENFSLGTLIECYFSLVPNYMPI